MKNVKFSATKILPSLGGIKNFEESLNIKLPGEYKKFMHAYEFSNVSDNKFHLMEHVSVDYFLTFDNSDASIQKALDTYEDRLPSNALPIASASGGNLILLHLINGGVYFWDHELEIYDENPVQFEACTKLAASFDEFLENLEKQDKLPEPKVLSVKIDPEFAKKMGLKLP